MYKTHLVKTFNLFTLNKAFRSNQDVTTKSFVILKKLNVFKVCFIYFKQTC